MNNFMAKYWWALLAAGIVAFYLYGFKTDPKTPAAAAATS
jgi:hypothetical protein